MWLVASCDPIATIPPMLMKRGRCREEPCSGPTGSTPVLFRIETGCFIGGSPVSSGWEKVEREVRRMERRVCVPGVHPEHRNGPGRFVQWLCSWPACGPHRKPGEDVKHTSPWNAMTLGHKCPPNREACAKSRRSRPSVSVSLTSPCPSRSSTCGSGCFTAPVLCHRCVSLHAHSVGTQR